MTRRGNDVSIDFPTGGILIIIIAILGIIMVLNTIAIVGPGQRGILMNWGQVEPYSLGEGFHWKIPIAQHVALADVKTQKVETGASSASKDLQVVSTTVALNYKLKPALAWKVYQEVGTTYRERVIDPAIQEAVKASTAQFTAEELITKRESVKLRIEELLRERLATYDMEVQNLSITNFEFSPEFNLAIEAKVKAEQDALKAVRELERIKVEKEQTITRAEAQNEQVKLEADATAYQILVNAQSEAEALRLVREQLEQSQDLVAYKAVTNWDGMLPKFTGGGAIPFIDVEGITE